MSCHYSCNSCSAPTYLYNCLACPTTRQLIGNICLCKEGFIEAQQSECVTQGADLLGTLFVALQITMNVFYFVNIGIFWLFCILTMCRINLTKIRSIILFSQLGSLVLYFPFYYEEISQASLRNLGALNFDYFTTLFSCTKSGMPSVCTDFENLIGPALVIPCFLMVFLISYIMMNICYRDRLQEPISIKTYIKKSWLMFIFNYIDLTAVYWSLSITRVVVASYWGISIAIIMLIALTFTIIKFYQTLNAYDQTTHLYRIKNNWAFIYDEFYHLYYIDYLYDKKKQVEEESQQSTRINIKMIRPFVPHSNFIILEILFKIIITSLTVVLYEYKPALFGLSVGILFLIGIIYFGAFQNYDRWSLLVYFVSFAVFMTLWGSFWTDFFWAIAISVAFLVQLALIISLGVLFAVKIKMDELQINKVYEQEEILHQFKEKNLDGSYQSKGEKISEQELLGSDPSDAKEQTQNNLSLKPSLAQLSQAKITDYSRPNIMSESNKAGLVGKSSKPDLLARIDSIRVKDDLNSDKKRLSSNIFDPKSSYHNSLGKPSKKNVLNAVDSSPKLAQIDQKKSDAAQD